MYYVKFFHSQIVMRMEKKSIFNDWISIWKKTETKTKKTPPRLLLHTIHIYLGWITGFTKHKALT